MTQELAELVDLEIERIEGATVEGDKRTYAPFVSKWTCPDCGTRHEVEHTSHYFSYPQLPGDDTVGLYCNTCDENDSGDCGDKGQVKVHLELLVMREGYTAVVMTEEQAALWKAKLAAS